jgi:beta-galactosidase
MNRRDFIFTTGAAVASVGGLQPRLGFAKAGGGVDAAADGPLLLGTDYYPDQTAETLWEQDAVAMAGMGTTNVRVAEFAWALMEPEESKFEFGWLHRAVNILNAHHIGVILGTPSAAPPNWLTQKYPEVLMVNDHGMKLATGARRFTCPTNKTYRRLALTVATEMAKSFSAAPGVVGWQIDNELTLGESPRCYCNYCREGFQQWLREKYGTLEEMNRIWGTAFWSQTYSDFSQVPVPLPSGAPPNPGLALDYDRYQSYANISFLEEQLTMLRKLCPEHFITTNNVPGFADAIDLRGLYRELDFVASDNYPGFFSIYMTDPQTGATLSSEAVAPMISFTHDFSRSVKGGKPFLIMEEQTGKAGQTVFAPQPEPGQLRLWTFQAVAHGAMGINYFRWDTATSGAEEYWHGLLKHDRTHSIGFDEIQRTMSELKGLGREALNAGYPAEAAICFDYNSDWAFAIQPGQPKIKYLEVVSSWYGSMSPAQAGVDIVEGSEDLSGYKIVMAPAMYIVSAQQAERIRSFVRGGGTFIAGFRLGVKDEHSRIVDTALPGVLRDVMGVEVFDYEPIYGEKENVRFSGMLAGPNAECRLWADILEGTDVEVLASYEGGRYAGKAAITSNAFGKGKAIYIGPNLEGADLGRVLLTLMQANGVKKLMDAPRGVEIARRKAGAREWTYLLNHASKEQTVKFEGRFKDALTGASREGSIRLEPYGVSVLETSGEKS